MSLKYSHDFIFERDFPENVKSIFFNGKTKLAKQLKVVH